MSETYVLNALTTAAGSDSANIPLWVTNIYRDFQQVEHPTAIMDGKIVTLIETLFLSLLC